METTHFGKIKRDNDRHTAAVSKQTGFPSAATHYLEPTIDLNKELTTNKDATFYVRVSNNNWSHFSIIEGDVLIIDRSLIPKMDDLVLAVQDGAFVIIQLIEEKKQEAFVSWGVITYIIHSVR